MGIQQGVRAACQYVEAGIKASTDIGKGYGPINHFHSTFSLPFAPGRFLEYVLDRPDVTQAWRQHTEHDFVNRMADGTLPLGAFKNYLVQDYLYLVQFARANALAAYKAKTMDSVAKSAEVVLHVHREMSMHIDYCNSFGLSRHEMESEEESLACTAYTRYVLDIGNSEGWLALQVSFAPCLIGYGAIARRLYDNPKTVREGNRYWKWIENYVAQDYIEAVKVGSALLETHAVEQSPSRIEELIKIFIQATKMEARFWDTGLASAK
ncbi:MAG: hypothetical protein M1835_003990 [Candelina submexicana]|nr:MAG: hypothetical protein M1835_003990 [Candelina submexicana]